MIENGELQKILKKYPDTLPIMIAISYNNHTSLFDDVEVKGVRVEGTEAVIVLSRDVNYEYETLLNGAEID